VIEDNDKVAHACLLEERKIVGDVWLYNRGEAPCEPEWTDISKAPFSNPAEFVKTEPFIPPESEADIVVNWVVVAGELEYADIFLRGDLLARLAPGSKPGWCVLARKDGPLAKVLEI